MNFEKEMIEDEIATLNQNILIVKNKMQNSCNKERGNQLLGVFQKIKEALLKNTSNKYKIIDKLPLLYLQIKKC